MILNLEVDSISYEIILVFVVKQFAFAIIDLLPIKDNKGRFLLKND